MTTTPFTTGPFLSASVALEDMAVNFYFAYLLGEAIEQQLECARALKNAIESDDADLIRQCEFDLALLDRAYELSLITERNNTVQ